MNKSAKLSKHAKQLIKDTKVRETKKSNDTLRLWESYREQALLWRGIALLQIVVTFTSIIAALVFYNNQEIKLNVPAKPLPGYYTPADVPESEYISVANEFSNLIYSYQFKNADRQFLEASKYLIEPMLSQFEKEMLGTELNVIKQSQRTQLYFTYPDRTTFERLDSKEVKVSLVGERLKTLAGEELPMQVVKLNITMTTIPRNAYNEFGIVVKSVELVKVRR